MKKHGFRSFFSLLLAVMMVCSMLPTAAFAEGNVEEQPVVVETYTVTYADGMGGAAFAEQKTEGLLYGDPTPAFTGEPTLDGYTFTSWDQEIAATVTESVTYTAQWQQVQADGQPEAQSDVQPEADGNGEIDTYWGGHGHPGGGDWHPGGPGDYGPHPDKPEPKNEIQISRYVRVEGQDQPITPINVPRTENGFAHEIPALGGEHGEVTSVTGDWTPNGSANEGDTVTWGHDAKSGYVVYNVAPQASNSTVVLHPSTGVMPTGFKVSVGGTINGYPVTSINSSNFEITITLDKYNVSLQNFRIPLPEEVWTGVAMQYNPQTYVIAGTAGAAQKTPGSTALLGNGENTFYYYNLGGTGGGDNPTSYLWNFTLHYDANGGTGAPADQTWGTNDKYTKSHTFDIPTTVPTREGYTFKGWSDTKGGSATRQPGTGCLVSQTVSGYNGGSVTKTLYAVWEENTLAAPGEDEVVALYRGAVMVECTNESAGHGSKSYDLTKDDIIGIGEPGKDSNGMYFCEVTITSDRFVGMFNGEKSVTHTPTSDTKTATLYYISDAWSAPSNDDGTIPVVFNVKCETATIPDPAANEFDDLPIQIKCDTKTDGSHDLQLSYKDGTYTFVRRTDPNLGYVVFTASTYLETYNKTHPGHELKNSAAAVTWEFEYKDGKWQRRVTDKLPTIVVVCNDEPAAPEKPSNDGIKELLSGEVVKLYHQSNSQDVTCMDRTYQLMDGTFEVGDVSGDAKTGYTCSVTIKAEAYLTEYNKVSVKRHSLATEETDTKTITLTWSTEGDNGRWVVQTETPVVFNVVCESTPPTDEPAAPTYKTIKNLTVKVVCLTHGSKDYGVVPAGLTVGEVQEQNGYYFCPVTIKSDAYVNDFNTKLGVEHTPKSEVKSVLLKYDGEVWVPNESTDSPVVFNVTCTTQGKPTEETIINDLGSRVVGVACTTMPNVHGAIYSALREGTFDISDVTTVNDLPSCTITIHAETYVSAFNNSTGVTHLLKYPNVTSKTLQLYYTDGKWTAMDGTTPVVFEVVCPTAPVDAPTEEEIKEALGKIQVKCVTDGSGHAVKEYDTSVGGYTATTMQDSDGKPIYTVTVTVSAQRYIEKYNEETGKTHQLASGEAAEKTIVLKYADKQWTLVEGTLPVVFQVVCEAVPAQKYTVTYTDGVDGVEVFKDQVYAGLTAGTVTPAFNGTPTRVGYVFAGWNPAVAATVTGNATYVATWKVDSNNNGKADDEETRYTVTYVDGANGKAFASQVYPNLLAGTATPKFNGTPLRSGYVFIGWSPVWSGTVTGNVTYTATWSTVTGGLDKVPKTGDNGLTLALSALVLFSFCGATACVISTKKRG